MKYRIIFFVSMYLLASGLKASGQDILHVNKLAGKCYASNSVNKVYIPPPKEFYQSRDRKGVNIIVNFTNFPVDGKARNAFNYAVSILSSILPDNTSFTVDAKWVSLTDNTILANTGVSTYFGGSFINALDPFVYYPIALAEKIAGKSLNASSEGDVIMNINSRVSWYTGTDGDTPVTMYDLVSVVLHELCHGIGFTDSFNVSGTTGSYGLNNIPLIYDTFVEDVTGHRLTDSIYYLNGSSILYSALTGGSIYFRGKVLSTRARLYAPSTWDAGSSISHLNELTYNGSQDALMTPFLQLGEAIHSPGTILRRILGDIGWINTRITHTPFKDTEQNLSQITFKAVVKSDTSFLKNKVGFVCSFDKFAGKDTVFMTQTGDTFSVQLAIPAYNTTVSYYFFVTDYFGRVYKLPSKGESSPYSFFIGTDTVKPTVKHTPLTYILDNSPVIRISAVADDNLGIDTVYVEYKNNDGSFSTLGLLNDSLDYYSNTFDLRTLGAALPDTFQYRIVAIDSSAARNKSYSPSADYYKVPVIKLLDVVTAYTTDFSTDSTDFINHGFSITTPSGFSDPALHSKHPYESPEKDGDSIVYTSVLRHPVKVDVSGIVISFMEIVLVEPGESGSVYGSPDFYDYVVVEASKNFGKTWFPMADGYDSRITLTFLNDYTGSINGINSTFIGTASMFHKHTIAVNTFTRFSSTDTLLIRFRLFSDPYAHGWGWAVDDLSIKSVAADVPKTEFASTKIFPNPGNGLLQVYQAESSGKETDYQVLNIMGMKIKTGRVVPGTSGFIDISDQPPGIYIIVIGTGNSVISFKYTKLR